MSASSILLVDDSPLILNVLASLLENAGYQTHKSENGKAAMEVLAKQEVDLIICDIMMPEMNGWDLHKYVRSQAELNHVPFVFLTSVNEQAEINQAKKAGADDYFVKPFNPADLVDMVQGKLLRANMLKNTLHEHVDKVKKTMLQSVSHELRTPLVAIKTGTEMLLQNNLVEDQEIKKDILKAIARGGERLESFVNDMITLQKFERSEIDKHSETCYPEDVIRQIIEKQIASLNRLDFYVRLELDPGIEVNMSQAHFTEIFKRLMVNSVKFSRERKVLKIKLYKAGEEVILEVCDRGVGLGDNQVKLAFDTFVQFDRERYEQQGVGLGLAIANYYANLYGANLELHKRPKGGTKAILKIAAR